MQERDMRILRVEIETDPLGRGYAGMTDAQVSASLNEANRQCVHDKCHPGEILNEIVHNDLLTVSVPDQNMLWAIIQTTGVSLVDQHTWELIQTIFPPGSQTYANLEACKWHLGSRAHELGLPGIVTVDVMEARRNL